MTERACTARDVDRGGEQEEGGRGGEGERKKKREKGRERERERERERPSKQNHFKANTRQCIFPLAVYFLNKIVLIHHSGNALWSNHVVAAERWESISVRLNDLIHNNTTNSRLPSA